MLESVLKMERPANLWYLVAAAERLPEALVEEYTPSDDEWPSLSA